MKIMAQAKMNSGWKGQSLRHSNAKRHGHAGGKYANTYVLTNVPEKSKTKIYSIESDGAKVTKLLANEGGKKPNKLSSVELTYSKELIKRADRLQLAELKEELTEANIKRTTSNSNEKNKEEQKEYERRHERKNNSVGMKFETEEELNNYMKGKK